MKVRVNPNFKIVVIQGGWVLAGCYSSENGLVTLSNSSVIQRWGTDKGIGQLAITGPTKDSIIHPCGTACVPAVSVLFVLDVKADVAEKWPV